MKTPEKMVPPELLSRLNSYLDRQQGKPWSPARTATIPDPPFPAVDNPMLEFVVLCAADIMQDDVRTAILHAASHCWMEGHVEGYDQAMTEIQNAL